MYCFIFICFTFFIYVIKNFPFSPPFKQESYYRYDFVIAFCLLTNI